MQAVTTIKNKQKDSTQEHPALIVHEQEGSFVDKHPVVVMVSGLLVLTGLGWLGQRWLKHHKATSEQKRTLDENDPAAYAQRIKMAFENDDWGGTNMEELRSIFRDIPSKDFKSKVDSSYAKLFNNKSLDEDLHSELQTTQYNEIMAIMGAKPDRVGQKSAVPVQKQYEEWAKRLKAAFDKTYSFLPGTDEPAIKAVFMEIPSQAAFVQVGNTYQKLYGNNLITDLKSELEYWEYPTYMAIITSKP